MRINQQGRSNGRLRCAICGRAGRVVAGVPLTIRCEEHSGMDLRGQPAEADEEDHADLLAHLSCLAMDDPEEEGES